jgi:hypothetical protein
MHFYGRARTVAVSLAGAFIALVCLGAPGPVRAADDAAPRLEVDYNPPRLSVQAQGLTLARVLSEIGAKVGFTVVDNGASSTPVDVSIRDASLDDALRKLLRGENHTVLYFEGRGGVPSSSAGIDKIVLLGAPTQGTVTAERADRQQVHSSPVGSDRVRPSNPVGPTVGPPVTAAPPSPEPAPLSRDRASSADSANDPANAANTVGEILKTHAMSAAQTAQESTDSPPALATGPASVEAALAETTRRAQQDLSALVDGLATATRSLQDSLAGTGHR